MDPFHQDGKIDFSISEDNQKFILRLGHTKYSDCSSESSQGIFE